MNDGSPTLGVTLEVGTGSSVEQIARLKDMMDSAQGQTISSAASIERATSNMIKAGPSVQAITAIRDASTREARAMEANATRVEKSINATIRQMQRQAETYGMTAAQARSFRNEQRAIAADDLGLTEKAAELRALNAEMARLEGVTNGVSGASMKNRMAMQGASYQVQDFITQVSMGANPVNAFAVQGAQLAGQFSMVEGKAGAVARFFMGPWGLAITAGLMVFGPFIAKLFESNDALDEAAEKLRKDAAETEATRQAKERFADTSEGVRQAILDQKAALDQNANSLQTEARRARDAAEANLLQEIGIRSKTKAILEEAAAYEARFTAELRGQLGAEGAAGFDTAAGEAAGRVAQLRKDAAEQDRLIAIARQNLTRTQAALDVEVGKRQADTLESIRFRYEGAGGLIDQAERRAIAEGKVGAALQAQIKAVVEKQKAEEAAFQATERSGRSGPNDGVARFKTREQAIGMAGRELQGAGLRVDGNVQFGYTGGHANDADHNKYAADVNVGKGVVEANVPDLKKRFDELARLYQARGFDVVWNKQYYAAGGNGPTGKAAGHENHLHLKAPAAIVGKETQASSTRQALTEQARILADQKREYDNAVKGAEDYVAAQAKVSETTGMTAIEMRRYADAAAIAKAPTEELKKAIQDAADARENALATQAATDFAENVIKPLQDELALYGMVGPAREAAALALEKEGFIARQVDVDLTTATARWDEYYKIKSKLIAKDAAAEAEVERIKRMREELDLLIDSAREAGDAFARAFGGIGNAVADVIDVFSEFQKRQADLEEQRKAAAGNQRLLELNDKRSTENQLQGYTALAGAAKGFFKEGTAGYEAMAAAEKAFALVQLANTAVNVAAGAAKMFASLGPWAFPAVAAMVGVMAAFGFGGGTSSAAGYTPETNTGTGTVFGDSSAQSDSIKNAIDALREVDTVTSVYARQMASSLKSIESQIGGLASLVVRAGDINASGGVSEGFKANFLGSVLGAIPLVGGLLKGLFGSTTTVIGSGLFGGPQSIGSILGGGFDASYFSDVQKKSRFLGITTGTKNSTQYTGADAALESQFTLLLRSFNDAILAAAGPLGMATGEIQSRLNSFVVSIGKIDLKGLTGEQIQEKLAAVFGAAADNMANAAFPGIAQFQKVGEGAFETLVRVASTVEAVSSTLDLLGKSAQGMSIAAKIGLTDQFDSVSALTDAADSYFQAFYSKEEQTAARTAQLGRVFTSLGIGIPATLAAFRGLVEAQDLTTSAGQETYATLLKLAPAFADLQTSMEGVKSAADIASERADLQRQLLQVQGNQAALREMDLAKIDVSNRALQQQIWAIEDAQEAARAAEELRQAWKSVGDTIMDEVRRIRGLDASTGEGGFAALMGRFNAATAAARGGDMDAAKSLPQLSQALLAIAANTATSRQELSRVQAQTAASLEATYGAIGALNASSATNAALVTAAATNQAANTPSNDNAAAIVAENAQMRTEIAQLRSDLNLGMAKIAENTAGTKRILENVTANTGDAISTVAAA